MLQWKHLMTVFEHVYFLCVCVVQDIDYLQQIWEIREEWNSNWDIWKVGQFYELRTENMETTAQDTFRKLHKLKRELKVSSATVSYTCHRVPVSL